jgi:hypothetical protein
MHARTTRPPPTTKLLDMPELLWKSYIDFEIAQKEHERARVLYERLLERTAHIKVFISFAQFEATAGDAEAARGVFERAFRCACPCVIACVRACVCACVCERVVMRLRGLRA